MRAAPASKTTRLQPRRGQVLLAHAYHEVLRGVGLTTAQVLLTLDDSESRRRYLNACRTLLTLLARGAVPVVNENDTVATQELRYGDNDRLAARVAQMVSADCMVLLSDVDGLYTCDPQRNDDAEHVPEVAAIDERVRAMAGGPSSTHGSGGMHTKLDAARIATGAGCRVAITSGRIRRPLKALSEGRAGDMVSVDGNSRRGPQAMDRGHAATQGQRQRRCRCGAGAGLGPEPPSGRRDRGRRALRARRCGTRTERTGRRGRPRTDRLFVRRGSGDRRQAVGVDCGRFGLSRQG